MLDPTQGLYLDHLAALPWRDGRTEAAVRAMIVARAEPHLPSIGVVVAAAGVQPEAAHLLVEAMKTGQELVPDLASRTGWAVGAPARALPAEDVPPAKALNPGVGARPAPPEPTPEAAFTDEQRRENLKRLGSLFREMKKGKAS